MLPPRSMTDNLGSAVNFNGNFAHVADNVGLRLVKERLAEVNITLEQPRLTGLGSSFADSASSSPA